MKIESRMDIENIRRILVEADSTLGYLRHRCGINWDNMETIRPEEVDDLCHKIRQVTDELATRLPS